MILCDIVCDLPHGLYVLSPTTKNARPNGRTINVKQALPLIGVSFYFPNFVQRRFYQWQSLPYPICIWLHPSLFIDVKHNLFAMQLHCLIIDLIRMCRPMDGNVPVHRGRYIKSHQTRRMERSVVNKWSSKNIAILNNNYAQRVITLKSVHVHGDVYLVNS